MREYLVGIAILLAYGLGLLTCSLLHLSVYREDLMAKRSRSRTAFVSTTADRRRVCPVCQRSTNAVLGVSLEGPCRPLRADDYTVCGYCGTLLAFTVEGYRVATTEEWAALDPRLRAMLEAYQGECARDATHH